MEIDTVVEGCRHPSCVCERPPGKEFCSEYCADSRDGGSDYACRCGHPECEAAATVVM